MKPQTMTSRERLLKALNHEEPDRVPIDLGGNQTGIHKFAYEALVKHLGVDESYRSTFCRPPRRSRFAKTSGAISRSGNRAAATSSTTSTTSRPASRPRTSWRCTMRRSSLGGTRWKQAYSQSDSIPTERSLTDCNDWSMAGPAHHCAIGLGHVAGKIEKLGSLLRMEVRRVG